MRPRSETLFHFTQSIESVKGILRFGMQPSYCLEDRSWLSPLREMGDLEFAAIAMSCFCDIPLSRISEHTRFYGRYGIGLTKEWGIRNSLNPVIYAPPQGFAMQLVDQLATLSHPMEEINFTMATSLVAMIKPLCGRMHVNGRIEQKDFYQENEWRYVPNAQTIISKQNFEVMREEENQRAKVHAIPITPTDIKYIIVACDEEIAPMIDYVSDELVWDGEVSPRILLSRIISSDAIERDF